MLICAANIVVGLAFAVSGLLAPAAFYWFVLLTAAEGIAGGIFNASFISVVQTRIAPDRLGRVLSIYFSLGVLPAMLAVLGTGALADGIGIERTFVVAGSVIVLLGTAGLLLPEVVALDRRKR